MNWACRDCGSILLVGLQSCPHCRSEDIATDPKEVEEIMAKAHRDRAATRFTSDPQTYSAYSLETVDTKDAPELEEVEAPDYDTLTVPQLQAELDSRRNAYVASEDEEGAEAVAYTKKDKKEDLIILLREDDEANSVEVED